MPSHFYYECSNIIQLIFNRKGYLVWIALGYYFLGIFYLFVPGAIRSLRANKITITKANAMTTSPGKPYSSAIPVPAKAVVVGATVNFAARAA
jgi:hypothetical protein